MARRAVPFLSAAAGLLCVLAPGCVMPDQIAQLRKDVADVRQQMRQLRIDQATAQEQLERIEGELESGPDLELVDLADVRLQLEEFARSMAILDERVNDAHRRVDGISQDVQEVRELARRRPSDGPLFTSPLGGIPGAPTTGLIPGPADDPANVPAADALPSPEELYNAAYADFSKGNFSLAVSGFEEYVERFPESDMADNALYWIGDCRYSEGDFEAAILAYDRLLGAYPRSDRAAAADLKKGLAYLEQNQVGKAIVQLQHVTHTYPSSDESRVARDKLASLGASG